ncbi:MAG: hypothetical protein Q8M70_04645, partial [bacterium]|nr:hypothetical protein [bacterium]
MSTQKNYSREKPGQGQGQRGQGPGYGMAIGRPAEKAKDFKGTTKRLLQYMKPHRLGVLFMVFASIITTILGVIAPNFTRQILNNLQAYINGS